MASTRRGIGSIRSLGAGLLAAVGGLVFAGGVLGVVGVIDAESEVGRSGHPLLFASLMVGLGVLYGLAGGAALSGHRHARALTIAALLVMALQVSVRLAMFGLVGVGDLTVLAVVASFVIRDRIRQRASS